jgi:hypothetical protein
MELKARIELKQTAKTLMKLGEKAGAQDRQ